MGCCLFCEWQFPKSYMQIRHTIEIIQIRRRVYTNHFRSIDKFQVFCFEIQYVCSQNYSSHEPCPNWRNIIHKLILILIVFLYVCFWQWLYFSATLVAAALLLLSGDIAVVTKTRVFG